MELPFPGKSRCDLGQYQKCGVTAVIPSLPLGVGHQWVVGMGKGGVSAMGLPCAACVALGK